jgi:hypothetical protein
MAQSGKNPGDGRSRYVQNVAGSLSRESSESQAMDREWDRAAPTLAWQRRQPAGARHELERRGRRERQPIIQHVACH